MTTSSFYTYITMVSGEYYLSTEYITDKLLPLLLKIPGIHEQQNALEVILSKETLKILQLLGFNYKEAIGEPLTSVIAHAINALAKKANTGKQVGKK